MPTITINEFLLCFFFFAHSCRKTFHKPLCSVWTLKRPHYLVKLNMDSLVKIWNHLIRQRTFPVSMSVNCQSNWKRKACWLNFAEFGQRSSVLWCFFDGFRLLKWTTIPYKVPKSQMRQVDLTQVTVENRTSHPGWFWPHCKHLPVLPKKYHCHLVLSGKYAFWLLF